MALIISHLCKRYFSVRSKGFKNYYITLGVPPNATQSEIKAAYYKLSMVFHPDRNAGSKQAAEKFQLITEAYEVLGNHEKRRRYNKGFSNWMDDDDDSLIQEAMTKKPDSSFQKHRPVPTGRTPIYNYDEWSRSHYGQSFARRNAAKNDYNQNKESALHAKREHAIFILLLIITLSLLYSASYHNKLDRVPEKENEKKPLGEPKKN